MAVGSGWQAWVAYINLGCYYGIGLPLGFIMQWYYKSGVSVRASSTTTTMFFESITTTDSFEFTGTGHLGRDVVWRKCVSNSDIDHHNN